MRDRPRRSRQDRLAVLAAVAVAIVSLAACGDDGGDDDDARDEADFCRLALRNDPIDVAGAPVMRRLEELAPGEVREQVVVLRELADELEGVADDDPEGLTLEFEVRFSEEYIEARRAVEDHIATACPSGRRASTATSTTESGTGSGTDRTEGGSDG